MYWICEFFDSYTAKDATSTLLAEQGTFLVFKRKKNVKKYLLENTSIGDEYFKECVHLEKIIGLNAVNKFFGNYKYKII